MTDVAMSLNEADTRAKLIDPAIHKCGWTEDLIRREETAGTVEIINGKARPAAATTRCPTCGHPRAATSSPRRWTC
jgi:type I site-specific restriction endonuclease